MVDSSDITTQLNILGLDDREAAVYSELVERDAVSILELSRRLEIPRTNVYRTCEGLVKKNFAEWVILSNTKKVKAILPKDLIFVLNEQKQKLEESESALTQLSRLIQTYSVLPQTQVRYYEGREGLKQIMWNCLKAEKEVLGYTVYGRKNIVGEKFNTKYVEEFRRRNLRDRTIINEEGLNYLKKNKISAAYQQLDDDVRFIKKTKFYVEGDISIYNNTYAICFWRDDEVVGVEIENSEFVKNQISIFNILWDIAEPLKKTKQLA